MTSNQSQIALTACGTMVLWGCCLAVGVTGLALPHQLPPPPPVEPPPIAATMLNVSIGDVQASPAETPATPQQTVANDIPPPPETVAEPSSAPPMQAVAAPSALIAFAVPTKNAGAVVSAAAAVPSQSTGTAAGPAVQHLVYGQGEGQQPAPEYPREAALAGQQGTVIVRFIVGENGRVESAAVETACSSPILNDAAVRAVRDTWRFKPGPRRTFDVSIDYQLK